MLISPFQAFNSMFGLQDGKEDNEIRKRVVSFPPASEGDINNETTRARQSDYDARQDLVSVSRELGSLIQVSLLQVSGALQV